MRELTFVVEPPVGPGEVPRRGSLADLVLALPYVVGDKIPPRPVLNDVLRQGFLEAGMSGGCLWKPFEIDAAEYQELIDELQRRGTRPDAGRDPGGKRFDVPDTPDRVRTYSDWVAFLYEDKFGSPPTLPPDPEEEDISSTYDSWLDRLPVGDLYLGYLEAIDRDWREREDDAFDLPAELVFKLRELAALRDEWMYERGDPRDVEYRRRLGERATQAEQVRQEVRACVDRLALPRWPY